jgi:hypothetical protein
MASVENYSTSNRRVLTVGGFQVDRNSAVYHFVKFFYNLLNQLTIYSKYNCYFNPKVFWGVDAWHGYADQFPTV